MIRQVLAVMGVCGLLIGALAREADALGRERWVNAEPYGFFFNDYGPNFYTGFAPREQDRRRITVHLGRGNQLRLRIVLSDEAIGAYIPDQVARHDLYEALIAEGVIQLTTNTAWESYDRRFAAEGLAALAAQRADMPPAEWRELNLRTLQKLMPERVFHVRKDFPRMLDDWKARLAAGDPPATLEAKLEAVNDLFPHRMFVTDLDAGEDAAVSEVAALARGGDAAGFRRAAETLFQRLTGGIYPVVNGTLDYWEVTAIYAAGTHDSLTTYAGHQIPVITTQGVWPLIPRRHGKGFLGMVDYISSEGYYGLKPMLPYEYGGGISYNAIHNTGISNWIGGHPLLPKEWSRHTEGSRDGKPYRRVALTSRGPVSHGCTRLNDGHLAEFREMLPSTSEGMEGIVTYRNVSQCYDVFDPKADGDARVMGVQYYIAFRHTDSRVMEQTWAQNDRRSFYEWLYGPEMVYGPLNEVVIKEACDGRFLGRKARVGRTYRNIKVYEAAYEPETVQMYTIEGVDAFSRAGMDFNRELRRIGHGYTVDRKLLRLDARAAGGRASADGDAHEE
ncbi:MAG: hypothetical protein IT294_11080 [Deltaproteobacteria bacterium]|nr:hypothetical protein [Deltaproteobacteria bacterium]